MGISIGLVGLGAFGSAFADLFKKHPLVYRIGLCDTEPERVKAFAQRPDWQDKFHPRDAFADLDAICRSDFDALVIITQHWLHAPQCLQALQSGKHVYSAVPIICIPDGKEILDWCDKLVTAVEKTGQHYMLGETTFYHPQAMYCRRRAAEGAFGHFTYSEGEYRHAFDSPGCDLRGVLKHRRSSQTGRDYEKLSNAYHERGIRGGPMHYPTHSVSGPMCVMNAHATKVCAWGQRPVTDDPYFAENGEYFANETALFHMSNGSVMRICEHRECTAASDREDFRIYGTLGTFEQNAWCTREKRQPLTVDEMRDPLPPAVAEAWKDTATNSIAYGGHNGSHAFLVHEFVDAIAHDRVPAINIWEAARYVAAGATAHQSALKDGELLPIPDWGDAPR
jgi:predicted dehydrogenase